MIISPYLASAARRANISAKANYQRSDYYAARTQREAGIEHHTWEDRIRPLRPWFYDGAAFVAWAIFAISAFWAFGKVFQ